MSASCPPSHCTLDAVAMKPSAQASVSLEAYQGSCPIVRFGEAVVRESELSFGQGPG